MKENVSHKQSKGVKIDQVFVGAWNAVKPESQGKAIMRVFDKYFRLSNTKNDDDSRAQKIRPNIEKVVGWSALGVEVGIISLAVIKGYKLFTSHTSLGGEDGGASVIQIPEKIYQGNAQEQSSRHPLFERVAELLRDEPFVTMALSSGGFSVIKTVILDEEHGNRVSVTAYGLQDTRNQRQEFRVDVIHAPSREADIFAVTHKEGHTKAEHVHIPLTQFDMQGWPFMVPSDSLNTSSLGSEAQWLPVTKESIDGLLAILSADIDAASTEKRRTMMNTVSRQMKKKNTDL